MTRARCVIDAADLPMSFDAKGVQGVWLQPLDDEGDPTGPWRHFPVKDGAIRLAEPDPVVVEWAMKDIQL